MLKYIVYIGLVIAADPDLNAGCVVSALGLMLSATMLPRSHAQFGNRPLLYAHLRDAS